MFVNLISSQTEPDIILIICSILNQAFTLNSTISTINERYFYCVFSKEEFYAREELNLEPTKKNEYDRLLAR